MTPNRDDTQGGPPRRDRSKPYEQRRLDERRADMQAAEGHAGSVPRGNQQPEREIMGSHRIEWDRVLGH